MPTPDFTFETIETVAAAMRAGRASPRALTDACLARARALNPSLCAYTVVFDEAARAAAAEAEREMAGGRYRGPLHGIPVSVKDLIDIRGTCTSAASRIRLDHRAQTDAPVIRRLREAGAILIAKCNLHEFALGTTSEASHFGPVHNPWDLTRSAGGSSGGSASAVAAGLCFASIGTDTGGSIRIPAAACGVVGFKPTYGLVPTAGVVPLSWSLDHVGPLARTVTDAGIVLNVLAGEGAAPDFATDVLPGLRIGVPRAQYFRRIDREVAAAVTSALDLLCARGARATDVECPGADEIPALYPQIVLAEALAFHEATLAGRAHQYTDDVRTRLESGRITTAPQYIRAQRRRGELTAAYDDFFRTIDLLALPTLPMLPPVLGQAVVRWPDGDEKVRAAMLRLTQPFSMFGLPVVSLPCGFSAAKLPIGLQLVGAAGDDARVLRVARVYEAATEWRATRPPIG